MGCRAGRSKQTRNTSGQCSAGSFLGDPPTDSSNMVFLSWFPFKATRNGVPGSAFEKALPKVSGGKVYTLKLDRVLGVMIAIFVGSA